MGLAGSTSKPRVFHVETTWKMSFSRRFNVKYTWCVLRWYKYLKKITKPSTTTSDTDERDSEDTDRNDEYDDYYHENCIQMLIK